MYIYHNINIYSYNCICRQVQATGQGFRQLPLPKLPLALGLKELEPEGAVTDHPVDLLHPSPEPILLCPAGAGYRKIPPLPRPRPRGLFQLPIAPAACCTPIIDSVVNPCCSLAHPCPYSLPIQQHTDIAQPYTAPIQCAIAFSLPMKKKNSTAAIQQHGCATHTAFHCPVTVPEEEYCYH